MSLRAVPLTKTENERKNGKRMRVSNATEGCKFQFKINWSLVRLSNHSMDDNNVIFTQLFVSICSISFSFMSLDYVYENLLPSKTKKKNHYYFY